MKTIDPFETHEQNGHADVPAEWRASGAVSLLSPVRIDPPGLEGRREMAEELLRKWGVDLSLPVPSFVLDRLATTTGLTPAQARNVLQQLRGRATEEETTPETAAPTQIPDELTSDLQRAVWTELQARNADLAGVIPIETLREVAAAIGATPKSVQCALGRVRLALGIRVRRTAPGAGLEAAILAHLERLGLDLARPIPNTAVAEIARLEGRSVNTIYGRLQHARYGRGIAVDRSQAQDHVPGAVVAPTPHTADSAPADELRAAVLSTVEGLNQQQDRECLLTAARLLERLLTDA